MSSADPTYQDLKQERLDSYKKIWRWFLWLGWPAAFLTMWLGGKIIYSFHTRVVALEIENKILKEKKNP